MSEIEDKKQLYNETSSTADDIVFIQNLIASLAAIEILTFDIHPNPKGGTAEDKNQYIIVINLVEEIFVSKSMADNLISHLKTVYLPGLKGSLEQLLALKEQEINNLLNA